MGQNILEISGIEKSYGGNVVLRDVEFSVRKGSIVGLIGANGAGKTTLLNILSGLLRQDKGDICFQGDPINRLAPHQRAAMGIGRTFQGGRVFNDFTVLQNIVTGGHVNCSYNLLSVIFKTKRFKKEEASLKEKGLEISDRTELGNDIHSKAGSLPYGQQRKVEIARALASNPKILLMDEPTAGMTHIDFGKLMEFIKCLVAGGLTVILVEHNMKLIMDICDRIVVLDFGRKIAEGTPEEIKTNEAVISAYLGGYLEGVQRGNVGN